MDILGGFIWLGLIALIGIYLILFGSVERKRK